LTGDRPGKKDAPVDLRRLDITSGGGAQVDVVTSLDGMIMGAEEYVPAPAEVEARIDVSSSGSGIGLRLRLATELRGPCQRCLADAAVRVDVDTRDFQAGGRDLVEDPDPDLDCEYLIGPARQELDVAAWARDAVVEAMPMTILCRPDCAGICPSCGTDLNAGSCDCTEEATDPRWAALGDLAARMREDSPDEA